MCIDWWMNCVNTRMHGATIEKKLQLLSLTLQSSVSQTFMLADLFWIRKITKDPNILTHVIIVCPKYRYPKSKIYISELICYHGVTVLVGQGLRNEDSWSRSDTPHSVEPPGRVINPTHRPLPHHTQHSQETDIHGPGGTELILGKY
jgi:hypothetical protein